MLFIFTIFHPSKYGYPLHTSIADGDTGKIIKIPLYLPKTGLSIYAIEASIKKVAEVIGSGKALVVNDYKQHITAFGLAGDDVHDLPMIQFPLSSLEHIDKITDAGIAFLRNSKLEVWHMVRAKAAVVYWYLQTKKLSYNYSIVEPIWKMDTYSGRSSCEGFPAQGIANGSILANVNGDNIFINFDWVSADLRMAAVLSGDPKLNEAFRVSDPYTYLADEVNQGANDLSRDEAKIVLLKSLYSLEVDSPVLEIFSGLKQWMLRISSGIDEVGQTASILGRIFKMSEDRSKLSVFNAAVQGSVAHAMQICMRKIWDEYSDKLLLENHDSITMTAKKGVDNLGAMIDRVATIMTTPFDGILESNPIFPVKVHVGLGYRSWKVYKKYGSQSPEEIPASAS